MRIGTARIGALLLNCDILFRLEIFDGAFSSTLTQLP